MNNYLFSFPSKAQKYSIKELSYRLNKVPWHKIFYSKVKQFLKKYVQKSCWTKSFPKRFLIMVSARLEV